MAFRNFVLTFLYRGRNGCLRFQSMWPVMRWRQCGFFFLSRGFRYCATVCRHHATVCRRHAPMLELCFTLWNAIAANTILIHGMLPLDSNLIHCSETEQNETIFPASYLLNWDPIQSRELFQQPIAGNESRATTFIYCILITVCFWMYLRVLLDFKSSTLILLNTFPG